MPQPDYRIHEMNKRLQQRTDDSDNLWWDAFATEFFEDDANLTLTFCLEDGPKRYSKLFSFKVEKILKGSLDLIPSPSFIENSNYGRESLLEV